MASAHIGRSKTVIYRPILTSGRSDLAALHHLDSATAALVGPVIEVSASGPTELFRRLPPGLIPAVDLGGLADADDASGLVRGGVPVLPVIGLAERDERLAAQGAVARFHLRRAVVRFRVRSDRGGPDAATGAVERIWWHTGLTPEQCDLLVDVGDVCCPTEVRGAEPRVRRIVSWARRHSWCSVTVAAGAMPPAVDGLPLDEPVPVVRWDWLLWQHLADLGVGYGDYGIRPAAPRPVRVRNRLPTIRYTTDGSWWIYRWARRGGRGDRRAADLCRAVVRAPHWPPTGGAFSWGDHEILRHAHGVGGRGSTPTWAAWSTSHHMAHVVVSLSHPPRWRPTSGHGGQRTDRHGGRGPRRREGR